MGADERLYFHDDAELGIQRNRIEEHHFPRSIECYRHAIELTGRRGGLWLDAGSGSGYGAELISAVADYVIGVEKDPTTVRYARKHYGRSNIQFRVGDISELEFTVPDLFDVIIAVEIIEHIADGTPFLERAYTILKPGGVAIVTTPEAAESGPNPLNAYHLHEMTREEFTALTSRIFDRTEYVFDEPAVFTTGEMTRQIFAVCHKKDVK